MRTPPSHTSPQSSVKGFWSAAILETEGNWSLYIAQRSSEAGTPLAVRALNSNDHGDQWHEQALNQFAAVADASGADPIPLSCRFVRVGAGEKHYYARDSGPIACEILSKFALAPAEF